MTPKLERAEIERAKRKPTESLDSYDYFLRGMAAVYQWTRPDIDKALKLFYRAIELDPNFVTAHGMAAWCYLWRSTNGWTTERAREIAETARLARRVAELGKDDAIALSTGGLALAYVTGDLEGGAALIDRALALNPNLTTVGLPSCCWVSLQQCLDSFCWRDFHPQERQLASLHLFDRLVGETEQRCWAKALPSRRSSSIRSSRSWRRKNSI
jgi:hypothetical protein